MKTDIALGREYIQKVCEILEQDPNHTASVCVHFDPQDFVWADIRMIVPREMVDRVVKLFEDAKNQVPIA